MLETQPSHSHQASVFLMIYWKDEIALHSPNLEPNIPVYTAPKNCESNMKITLRKAASRRSVFDTSVTSEARRVSVSSVSTKNSEIDSSYLKGLQGQHYVEETLLAQNIKWPHQTRRELPTIGHNFGDQGPEVQGGYA